MTSSEDNLDPQKLLNAAITCGDITNIIRLLDDRRVDLDKREPTYDHQTPLMRMCHMRSDPGAYSFLVERLESSPWNPNIQDATGRTLLMHACIADNEDFTVMALENRCDVSLLDRDGNSALFYAIRNGNEEILGLILQQEECSALLTQANNLGQTPVDIAQHNGHMSLVPHLTSLLPPQSQSNKLLSSITPGSDQKLLSPPKLAGRKSVSRTPDKFLTQTHQAGQPRAVHKPTGSQNGQTACDKLNTVGSLTHGNDLKSPNISQLPGQWRASVTSNHSTVPAYEGDGSPLHVTSQHKASRDGGAGSLRESGSVSDGFLPAGMHPASRRTHAKLSFDSPRAGRSFQHGGAGPPVDLQSWREQPSGGSQKPSLGSKQLLRIRKDSVSLPDLRDFKGKLVTSGDVTASVSETLGAFHGRGLKEGDREVGGSGACESHLGMHKETKSCALPPINSSSADADHRKDRTQQYPRTKKQVSSDDILLRGLIL